MGELLNHSRRHPLMKHSRRGSSLPNGRSTKMSAWDLVRLEQIARPASLSTNALGPPAPSSPQLEAGTAQGSLATDTQQPEDTNSRHSSIVRSQQDGATDSDAPPPHAGATQQGQIQNDQRNQKRTASLSESDKTKRRKMSTLAALKRKKTPQTSRSRKRGVEDDEPESEASCNNQHESLTLQTVMRQRWSVTLHCKPTIPGTRCLFRLLGASCWGLEMP